MKSRSFVCDVMRIEAAGLQRLEEARMRNEALVRETEAKWAREADAEKDRLEALHRAKVEESVRSGAVKLAALRAELASAAKTKTHGGHESLAESIVSMVYGEP